jgi:hypothetical protein
MDPGQNPGKPPDGVRIPPLEILHPFHEHAGTFRSPENIGDDRRRREPVKPNEDAPRPKNAELNDVPGHAVVKENADPIPRTHS